MYYRLKFHSVFASFTLHPCMKLVTNKWQPLPRKVLKRSVWDVLIIHFSTAFVSHGCLFNIHVTVAQINWSVFQTKIKLNLYSAIYFMKID